MVQIFNMLQKLCAVILVMLQCALIMGQKVEVGQIITPKGEILIALSNDAPNHTRCFKEYARAGYWDSSTFNRVIPNFVAQGGCPDTDAGFTDSAILIPPEFSKNLRHYYGAVGFGRDDNKAMYSARCQIYITTNKKGEHRLNDKYSLFGYVIKGFDVLDAISNAPRNKQDVPLEAITMDVNVIKIKKKQYNKLLAQRKKLEVPY